MLHEILWQQNVRLAEVCLHHPFVRGLADGTLDPKLSGCIPVSKKPLV